MIDKIKPYAKFVAAILSVIVSSGVGLIPADWAPWLQLATAIAGAIAVYAVPNTPEKKAPYTDEDVARHLA